MVIFRILVLVGLSISLAIAGCGDKVDPLTAFDDPNGEEDGPVTYMADIKSILDDYCIGCHSITKEGFERQGAPVGVDFDTYEDAADWADPANQRIQGGTMPPGGQGLSQEERALFQRWIDDGLLEEVLELDLE